MSFFHIKGDFFPFLITSLFFISPFVCLPIWLFIYVFIFCLFVFVSVCICFMDSSSLFIFTSFILILFPLYLFRSFSLSVPRSFSLSVTSLSPSVYLFISHFSLSLAALKKLKSYNIYLFGLTKKNISISKIGILWNSIIFKCKNKNQLV